MNRQNFNMETQTKPEEQSYKAIKPRYYGSNAVKLVTNKNFFIPSSIHKKKIKNKSPADNSKGGNFF